MAVNHYENFPVASILLPRHLRRAVGDIYRFARTADDIADEGDDAPAIRRAGLARYRVALHAIAADPRDPQGFDAEVAPIFKPLAATISRHQLPITPFSTCSKRSSRISIRIATPRRKPWTTTARGRPTRSAG